MCEREQEQDSGKRFVVAYVDYGDTCDGYPGILGIYDTLADAAQEMLADMYERRDKCDGKYSMKHSVRQGWLWEDDEKTVGCMWKVVEA